MFKRSYITGMKVSEQIPGLRLMFPRRQPSCRAGILRTTYYKNFWDVFSSVPASS